MAKNSKKRSIGHIKKLDDNKYLLRLSLGFDDFGKRIQPSKVVECTSDREAERLLYEFYNEREKLLLQHNSYVPKTLGQLYKYWDEHYIKTNLSPKTIEWYHNLWDKHIKVAEYLKTETLSPAHIMKIIDNVNGDRQKNAVYKMLKALFNKSVKWGHIDINPCDRLDSPKYAAPEKKVLHEKEILLVSKEIVKEDIKYQALFYFALLCSMRRQEIIGLKWSDIDFIRNEFRIKRAAIHLTGQGTVPSKTKTKKSERTLFLPDILKRILLKLRNEQNILREMYGDKWIDEDWIFTQSTGKMMNLHTPSHWWNEFSSNLGINSITFHGLRHTSATYMIKNNIPISAVSGVLGHANITTTLNTYTHVIEDTKKEAINIMADIVTVTDKKADAKAV